MGAADSNNIRFSCTKISGKVNLERTHFDYGNEELMAEIFNKFQTGCSYGTSFS